jgi:hypothetical protein
LGWPVLEIIAAEKLVENEANPALSSKDWNRRNNPTKQATPRISSLDKRKWVMG